MEEKIKMNYFWGQDVQMTQFYRVPKALYTAEYFRKICFEAKAIYGMMIDRVGLSIKNQWLDDEGRTYICYSISEIMEDTGCARNMVLKCMKELKEIELIETVKNTTKVRNIKAYLMAALFNAGSTMGSYYKAEVNHDMPQFAG